MGGQFSIENSTFDQANLLSSFPLSEKSLTAFYSFRKELCSACLTCIKVPFTVECDASDHTLGATLNQGGLLFANFYTDRVSVFHNRKKRSQ